MEGLNSLAASAFFILHYMHHNHGVLIDRWLDYAGIAYPTSLTALEKIWVRVRRCHWILFLR